MAAAPRAARAPTPDDPCSRLDRRATLEPPPARSSGRRERLRLHERDRRAGGAGRPGAPRQRRVDERQARRGTAPVRRVGAGHRRRSAGRCRLAKGGAARFLWHPGRQAPAPGIALPPRPQGRRARGLDRSRSRHREGRPNAERSPDPDRERDPARHDRSRDAAPLTAPSSQARRCRIRCALDLRRRRNRPRRRSAPPPPTRAVAHKKSPLAPDLPLTPGL